MIAFTKYFYLFFGLFTLLGGLVGYFKARSKFSLVAGLACATLLLVAFFLLPRHPNPSLLAGLAVSVLVLGQFLPKLLQREFLPHIILSVLMAAAGLVVTLASWYKP